MISTRDPRLLRRVIPELEGLVERVPAGKARWSLRTNLADALRQGGRPEVALSLYEHAVAEAEEAEHWKHVGAIRHNWAIALRDIGRLDDAKSTFLRSAEAEARAGSPELDVLISELEALRVEVMQGGAERALPEIESRLQETRVWWRRHRAGELVPEAPDSDLLARALIVGLDVARTVNLALERWEACLGVVTESEETQRAMGAEEPELARARANRYGPLLRLGRLDEAQKVLESSLAFFRQVGDLLAEATTLSALAGIWAEREDREHAAGLERQALSVLNRLSDLAGRSDSHFNLANYFDRLGTAGEAVRHRLAALAYDLIMGRRQGLAIVLHNLAILMRSAEALGRQYNLPRLAELLARPEFEPLQRTLTEWNVALDELQAEIDELVEEVRRGVEGPPEKGAGA